MTIASSRAIMAITTSNSINVKPLFLVMSETPVKVRRNVRISGFVGVFKGKGGWDERWGALRVYR